MKKLFTIISLLSFLAGYACTTCNQKLQDMIYDSTFFPNLFSMLSAFIVLGLIVAFLIYLSTNGYRRHIGAHSNSTAHNPVPLTTAAIILGIGIGGFIDGIVLHQILQWHQMLSNKLAPITLDAKSVNMFWDGIFHAFTLIVVIVGIILLWKLSRRKDADRAGHLLVGGLLAGWGLFNSVEGIINHHILGLHNVRETANPEFWNYSFLAISLLMITIGYLLLKKRKPTLTKA